MQTNHAENQLRVAHAELNRRIAQLEETLLEKTRIGEALQDSEKRYRRLFESAQDGILILDAASGRVVDVNPFLMRLLGYPYDALCGKYLWELGGFKDVAASKDAFKDLQADEYIRYEDLPLETRDGRSVSVEFVSNVYTVDHARVIQCNIRDITERKRGEAERKRLLAAIEQVGEGIILMDAQGIIQFVNPAFERMTGYTRGEAVGRNVRMLQRGEQDESFHRHLWETITAGAIWAGRMVNRRKDGSVYTAEMTITPVRDAANRIVNHVAVKRDISEHLRMEAQLQQAQKMDAVGLLAGGVAHDYNNMLGVIVGYTELALSKVDRARPLHADLQEILKAAERSIDITRQLLAFARKQTIVPVALDLNLNVAGMLMMLRRLIGEDIELIWRPGKGSCPIKMDPAQIVQILTNLCVNARDAIAGVGTITVETGNANFDEVSRAHNGGRAAGEYVLLAVVDDGCGMEKEILDQIFEPFFTSKGVGLGTGLGLSTVYGIVKQNNGFIEVDSEPGRGAAFRIYLPRQAWQTVDTRRQGDCEIPPSRGETVLVVEDEPALLTMVQRMLESLGYRVLAAGTAGEAIGLAEKHGDELSLLISDVVMPEMNGFDLAEKLRSLCPGMKVLFMSGYTSNAIARRGVLDDRVNFLQKPFTTKDLAVKVDETMGNHACEAAQSMPACG